PTRSRSCEIGSPAIPPALRLSAPLRPMIVNGIWAEPQARTPFVFALTSASDPAVNRAAPARQGFVADSRPKSPVVTIGLGWNRPVPPSQSLIAECVDVAIVS